MDAIDELSQLSDSMKQAASLLADEDPDEVPSSSKRPATFLNVVALGNVGAGKSAVLNSLIGHPVLPTGENGATRAPIILDLSREASLSSKAIILQIDSKNQQVSASALRHSLQDRLGKGASGKNPDEIYLKLRTSTGYLMKKSGKTNGWSRRWFVLNEKTGKLGYTKSKKKETSGPL